MTPDDPGPRPLDAFGPRSWARPEITSFGRLPAATYLARPSALALDGEWAFALRARPEDVRREDLTTPADGWAHVEVPGCFTMQGFGSPQYTNVQMPFPGPPPHIPEENPTGVYRRRVQIPPGWAGQRVVLHVGGAEAVLYVHVDGHPVGMGKDSRLPQEFDLTGLVTPGATAEIALTVVRWSDATYLEDQDHWYHAGLHRGVVLYSTPPVHLRDVHAVCDYDPTEGRGALHARVELGAGDHPPNDWTVRVDVAGETAEAEARFEHPTNTLVNMAAFEGRGATLELDLPGVAPWSAEDPVLYDLAVELLDGGGAVVDRATLRVGFRRVEVVGPELRVNGKAVLVKGVNRHDHDPRRGKAVTRASIERDIVLMKQHNLNALRTSHYPNDVSLYETCDRLGMYVVDEADVESHAYLHSLSKDPTWSAAIVERVTRMALRDKNHPSVVMWSLGNESGVSAAHRAAAAWLRSYDRTRPVHYESGISEDVMSAVVAGQTPDLPAILARPRPESDVIAPMYPPVEALVAWATEHRPDRPLIMCEYCHAMGNSCGGLDEYWAAIRAHDGLQGGFLWDWVDQALVQELPDGTERLAYGGDFADEPNDGAFCMNGLVAADRTPHPSLVELAKISQPVLIEATGRVPGELRVTNDHSFVDLSWLDAAYEVTVDGLPVGGGVLELPEVPPGASVVTGIDLPPLDGVAESERADLLVALCTTTDTPWAPAGHLVAWQQVALVPSRRVARAPGERPGTRRNLEDLEPRLSLWRAPIDNETFGPRLAERWDRLGLPDAADRIPFGTELTAEDGAVQVAHAVTVPEELGEVARVGVRLDLGVGVDRVEWLGVGPHECYSDRRASGRFGRYVTTVDEWTVPYVHPQASGNRMGVRWLRFLARDGTPLVVIDELDDLQVSVSRHTDEELDSVSHLGELAPSDRCFVWIDVAHRGVGSGACGPDTAPAHRVQPGEYRWAYRLG